MSCSRAAGAVTSLALFLSAACAPGTRPPDTSPQNQAAAVAATAEPADAAESAAVAEPSPAQQVAANDTATPIQAAGGEPPTGWFCPMHADVTASEAGECSKCNMKLIAGNPFDTREYLLDVSTSPAAIVPGEPFTLILTVRHPATGEPVNVFEEMHERFFHLFVISQDMKVFQHIHPELTPEATWQIEVTVPQEGYYRVLSDFLPAGGSPQFLGRTLVTAGFDGDLLSQAAALTLDTAETKTVDTITAELALDPEKLLAGQYGHLTFTLTDARTGEPVTNLQPYLGAFGHTLILSEDMLDVVHSHPSPGPGNDLAKGVGGPRITFEGYLPRPGLYRAWTQLQRDGQLSTFAYTVRVFSIDEAFSAQR
jgi:hypothetical protein